MGKINQKLREKRALIKNEVPVADEVSHEVHKHEWTFVKEIAYDSPTKLFGMEYKSKYACHCGAVKKVAQFEATE